MQGHTHKQNVKKKKIYERIRMAKDHLAKSISF